MIILSVDDGWTTFKLIFKQFYNNHDISYSDYAKNKFMIGKNEVKLFKYMKKWYTDREKTVIDEFLHKAYYTLSGVNFIDRENFDVIFKRASEYIGTQKLPDKSMKIVVSFNFADWFMVSTGETWSSCLNVQSDYEACYWTGLPGLITDPNRSLIYLTDGKSKSYRKITVDRFISRTWGLLNHNNVLFPVRHYPSKIINNETLAKVFPHEVYQYSIEESRNNGFCKGKHPYKDIITNQKGDGIYIYQDGTCFDAEGPEIHIVSGHSGYHRLTPCNGKWIEEEDTLYDFTDGLDGLISRGCDIASVPDHSCHCYNCGDAQNEDDMFWADDRMYCESCFNDKFSYCTTCGDVVSNEDVFYGTDDEPYCARHFERLFSVCENCGETVSNDEATYCDCNPYCEICVEKLGIQECDKCGDYSIYNIQIGDRCLCETCFKNEGYIHCSECGEIVSKESICEYNGINNLCPVCYESKIQPLLIEVA